MRISRVLSTVVAPVALAAALLTGCTDIPADPESPPAPTGLAALSAQEILDKASEHSTSTSFRMAGDMTTEGMKMTIDMKIDGENIDGSISLEQGSFLMRKVGSDIYIQADAEFWGQFGGDAIAALLQGKWMKTSVDDASFGDMADVADLGALLSDSSGAVKGELTTIDGVPAIALQDEDGSVLYIAVDGDPRPLRIVGPDNQGQLDFTDYGASFEITAPPADEVVDLNALTSGG